MKTLPKQPLLFDAKKTLGRHHVMCNRCDKLMAKAPHSTLEEAFSEALVRIGSMRIALFWCKKCTNDDSTDIPADLTPMQIDPITRRIVRITPPTTHETSTQRRRRLRRARPAARAEQLALVETPNM